MSGSQQLSVEKSPTMEHGPLLGWRRVGPLHLRDLHGWHSTRTKLGICFPEGFQGSMCT